MEERVEKEERVLAAAARSPKSARDRYATKNGDMPTEEGSLGHVCS